MPAGDMIYQPNIFVVASLNVSRRLRHPGTEGYARVRVAPSATIAVALRARVLTIGCIGGNDDRWFVSQSRDPPLSPSSSRSFRVRRSDVDFADESALGKRDDVQDGLGNVF